MKKIIIGLFCLFVCGTVFAADSSDKINSLIGVSPTRQQGDTIYVQYRYISLNDGTIILGGTRKFTGAFWAYPKSGYYVDVNRIDEGVGPLWSFALFNCNSLKQIQEGKDRAQLMIGWDGNNMLCRVEG